MFLFGKISKFTLDSFRLSVILILCSTGSSDHCPGQYVHLTVVQIYSLCRLAGNHINTFTKHLLATRTKLRVENSKSYAIHDYDHPSKFVN